jgi:hypothetical protein
VLTAFTRAEAVEITVLLLAGALVLVVVAATAWLRKGRARAPLCAFALLLATLPPLLAVLLASRALASGFAGAAVGGFDKGTVTALLLRCVVLLAAGAALALLTSGIFTLTLAPLPFAAEVAAARPPASGRRALFLAAVALVGAGVAGAVFEHTRQSLDIAAIAILSDGRSAEYEEAARRYEVLSIRGSSGVGALSARIARGTLLGLAGAPYVAVVLFGVALVAAIVAWPVGTSARGAAFWLAFALALSFAWAVATVRLGWEARGLYARHSAPPAPAAPIN